MANYFKMNDKTFKVGDLLQVVYKITEGEKSRLQNFSGILIRVKGSSPENKMFTVRKISKSGIGVERIFPLSSPLIAQIKLLKQSTYQKAKAYFVRHISERQLRKRLFH